jgi:hypothetical protein
MVPTASRTSNVAPSQKRPSRSDRNRATALSARVSGYARSKPPRRARPIKGHSRRLSRPGEYPSLQPPASPE